MLTSLHFIFLFLIFTLSNEIFAVFQRRPKLSPLIIPDSNVAKELIQTYTDKHNNRQKAVQNNDAKPSKLTTIEIDGFKPLSPQTLGYFLLSDGPKHSTNKQEREHISQRSQVKHQSIKQNNEKKHVFRKGTALDQSTIIHWKGQIPG